MFEQYDYQVKPHANAAQGIKTYEYKVYLHKGGKEQRQLELVQECMKIGEIHCLYYWPALGRGRYHSTSYMLAARCWRERHQTIMHGSISSPCNYGKRMPLLFDKEC
jgi:hypothetical protein